MVWDLKIYQQLCCLVLKGSDAVWRTNSIYKRMRGKKQREEGKKGGDASIQSETICLWNPHLSQEQCYANSLSPYLQNSLSFSSCKYKTCSSILKCYWWCSDSWSLEYEAVINHITQQVLKTCKITLLVMKSSKLCFMILIWKKWQEKNEWKYSVILFGCNNIWVQMNKTK